MPRHILTIKNLGKDASWMILQQAIGIPDAKALTDFLTEKVAVLFFAKHSLPERLCVTAAFRQMGGATIYEGNIGWREEIDRYQENLFPIFSYYLDCMYVHAIPVAEWDVSQLSVNFPIINAGSQDAHPAHAIADIACMQKVSKNLRDVTASWIGCTNGTFHSLVAAMDWFPFSMRVFLPEGQKCSADIYEKAGQAGKRIVFVNGMEEAMEGADFVFAGCRGEIADADMPNWIINSKLLQLAKPKARLLLSGSPFAAIPVEPEILSSKVSMLARQAEYRLRVHKRMLHWVFEQA